MAHLNEMLKDQF